MITACKLGFLALSLLSGTETVFGRYQWMERDNKAVFLHPRRFGQEQPAVIQKLSAACRGDVCGTLSGAAVTPLLAAQPECSQQDMADQIIDAAAQFDKATQDTMIQLAIEYRQAEKNTPPDFTTNPPTNRNSVFCQKAPKNAQLNGLVQAQDPANDPNVFFDPATKASVKLGDQPNTFPFGTDGSDTSNNDDDAADNDTVSASASSIAATGTGVLVADCPSVVTVTVSGTASATPTDAVTVSVGGTASTAAATATSTASAGDIGDFGSCSVPQIEFGVGFDGRKETSFQPVDKDSFNHGSAQNIDIITQFICDTLTNTCDADDTAKATCDAAKAAADTGTAKTGEQADLFNAKFGITTNFADVAAVDNQGNVVPGTGNGSANGAATSASAGDAGASASATASSSATQAGSTSSTGTGAAAGDVGDFGKCSVPQIEFGVGFDGRKETSFQPVDKASFNHGSAQNIDIITQFICDTLTNTCDADDTAKATCDAAKAAADTGAAKTGEQADLFNAKFGITTKFADVDAVDDQGNVVGAAGDAAPDPPAATNKAPATAANTAADSAATNQANASSGNLQAFSGSLGASAPAVTDIGNGQFQVDGNSSFNNKVSALVRSCDVQHNQCANAANASGNKGDLTVAACDQQQNTCSAQAKAAN